jgi:cell division protein FtsQ
MPVRAPADKRFRRAHVTPARRRWRPSWPLLGACVLALAAAGYGGVRAVRLVLSAEGLTITRITVDGNARLSRGEVLALLGSLRGASMVTADLEHWRRVLLESPWVADAVLRRVLPGTLSVTIAERRPLAIGRLGGALYLVDETGVIIDEFGPNYAELDLPIVDGLGASRAGGALVDPSRAAVAARVLADLGRRPDIAARVSEIDVAEPANVAVILKGETTLLHLGGEQFAARLQAYLDLAQALHERVAQIDYVDLRFGERVYVRPQRGRMRDGDGH